MKGYTAEQAAEYIAQLFPTPKAELGDGARKRHGKIVSQVRGAWYEPSNRLPSIKGTWWSLYNTVSHFVDHGKPGRQATDLTARRESRFMNVTTGKGAALKDQAFALAMTMSA